MNITKERLAASTIILVERCYRRRLTEEERSEFYELTREELEEEHEYFQNLLQTEVIFT